MKSWITVVLVLVLGTVGCDSPVDAELQRAERWVAQRPDSAIDLLARIPRADLNSRHREARYALCYSQALFEMQYPVMDDSLTRCAVEYYDSRGSERERALAYLFHGWVLANQGYLIESIEAFSQAESSIMACDEPYFRGVILAEMGQACLHQRDYEGAVDYLSRALEDFVALESTTDQLRVLSVRASTYFSLYRFEESKADIERALPIARNLKSDAYMAYMLVHYWYIYKVLYENEPLPTTDNDWWAIFDEYCAGEIPHDYIPMVTYVYASENPRWCEERLHRYIDSLDSYNFYNVSAFAMMARVQEHLGQPQEAIPWYEAYITVSDSLELATRNNLVRNISSRSRNLRLQSENQELRQRTMLFSLLALVALLAVAMLVAVLHSIRQLRRREEAEHERELMLLRMEYAQMRERFMQIEQRKELDRERDGRLMEYFEHHIQQLLGTVKVSATRRPRTKGEAEPLSEQDMALMRVLFGEASEAERARFDFSEREILLIAALHFGFSMRSAGLLVGHKNIRSTYNLRKRLAQQLRNLNLHELAADVDVDEGELAKS